MFPPATGVRIGLFTPDRAFELVCREQIKNLREPALKLADLVTQQLITVLREGTVQVPSSSNFFPLPLGSETDNFSAARRGLLDLPYVVSLYLFPHSLFPSP